MHFCDTHIHLCAPDNRGRADARVDDATEAGIRYQIQPGVNAADWPEIIALCEKHPQVYAAPGLHPLYADQWNDDVAIQLRELVRHPKVVAIGEIGLDAAAEPSLERQEQVLRAQLQIAVDEQVPVVLHCRHKNGALLDILNELQIGRQVGGVWHGFSAGLAFARQVVAAGFCVGIGPILLRDNVRKLPETVIGLPTAVLLLETDAPDMTPVSTDLLKVAQRVADLRGISLPQTAQLTTANARRLFSRLQDHNR